VRNTYVTCPPVGDIPAKAGPIPHGPRGCARGGKATGGRRPTGRAGGGACGGLAGWWGNGLPRRRSVAGLRGRPATRGLRHGPDSYGRQQRGILGNGRKPDPATPRGGRRPSGCKPLLGGTNAARPQGGVA